MGLFEPHHLIIILIIALVIFGPGKIADLGGSLGRGIRDFKKAMSDETPPPPTATTQAAQPRQPEPIQQHAEPTAQPAATAAKETVETHG
jgi:sec-independent protein translocase protein TatA